DAASRLGITAQELDDTLYDAFGQRQISTIFTQLNQYHVVLEVDPKYQRNPRDLQNIYLHASNGNAAGNASAAAGNASAMVPLAQFTHFEKLASPLAVNHQGQFAAVTISFNLAPDASLGAAVSAINAVQKKLNMPLSVQASFQGTAAAFEASLTNEPLLILAALVTVYIVLGILY